MYALPMLYYNTDPCGPEAAYTVPGPRGRSAGALLRPHSKFGKQLFYYTVYAIDMLHVIYLSVLIVIYGLIRALLYLSLASLSFTLPTTSLWASA